MRGDGEAGQGREHAEVYEPPVGHCRERYSWNPTWRCWRRGWLFGRCTQHAIEHLRWRSKGQSPWWVTFDASRFSRPYVQIDRETDPPTYYAVGIGVDGCDPAVEIGWARPQPVDAASSPSDQGVR